MRTDAFRYSVGHVGNVAAIFEDGSEDPLFVSDNSLCLANVCERLNLLQQALVDSERDSDALKSEVERMRSEMLPRPISTEATEDRIATLLEEWSRTCHTIHAQSMKESIRHGERVSAAWEAAMEPVRALIAERDALKGENDRLLGTIGLMRDVEENDGNCPTCNGWGHRKLQGDTSVCLTCGGVGRPSAAGLAEEALGAPLPYPQHQTPAGGLRAGINLDERPPLSGLLSAFAMRLEPDDHMAAFGRAILSLEYDPKGPPEDRSAFVQIDTQVGGFTADLSLERVREMREVLLSFIPPAERTTAERFAALPEDLQEWGTECHPEFEDYYWETDEAPVQFRGEDITRPGVDVLGPADRLTAAEIIAAHRARRKEVEP